MRQFDKVEATFAPQRTDNLKTEAVRWIGQRAVWQASWRREDDESYAGEWVMVPCSRPEGLGYPGWAPLSDLADVRPCCDVFPPTATPCS